MASMVPYGRRNNLGDWFGAGNWFNAMNELAGVGRDDAPTASFMMDVQENPDGYVAEAFIPGVGRDEVDVELNEGRLNISVDKRDSEEVTQRNYVHRETTAYRAVRSVYLKDADTVGLTAVLKDGVLTVNVPKRNQSGNVTKVEIG